MGSTGIEAHKPTPVPSRREGRSLPPTPSEGGGAASLRGISLHAVCAPPPLEGSGEVSRGGRTTYLYLVKIKIHLMINSLVCVPSPF